MKHSLPQISKINDEPSLAELLRARKTAAQIVERFGAVYLPVFEALDEAVEEAQAKEAVLAKVRKIARD